MAEDVQLLEHTADYVLAPSAAQMYPHGYHYKVSEDEVSKLLEGAHRPGHFDGMLTVVLKLLNLAQAHKAYFGEKDFQQLQLVQGMVSDFFLNTLIVPCPTVREPDGLAMSSRNQYLSGQERATSTQIHRTLQGMRERTLAGESRLVVEAQAGLELAQAGFDVDYAAVRTPDLVEPAAAPDRYVAPGPRVALVAARLGRTRLIDNVEFEV